jgi:hypothetical protein
MIPLLSMLRTHFFGMYWFAAMLDIKDRHALPLRTLRGHLNTSTSGWINGIETRPTVPLWI